MLRFLFPRLTAARGQALFDALVAEARRPHWFIEGAVPDSVDGRYAVLASVLALAIVRLERGGREAQDASVALTERFVHAMDAEHRQMGLGDPALGKHVRKLVTSLGRRVEQWRRAAEGTCGWDEAVRASLYGGRPAAGAGHGERATRALWDRLERTRDEDLSTGRIM